MKSQIDIFDEIIVDNFAGGGGTSTGIVEVDTAAGYFKRTCQCGWSVEIKEG